MARRRKFNTENLEIRKLGPARQKVFNPLDYKPPEPVVTCIFCLGKTADCKPFQSRSSAGLSIYCAMCRTRIFVNTSNAGIVLEAYQRMHDDPTVGMALRATLWPIINQIKAEQGIP